MDVNVDKSRSGGWHVANFVTCRIGFSLERGDGEIYVESDEGQEALFDLQGDGWRMKESFGSVCGNVFVVEFDEIPDANLVAIVKLEIEKVMNDHSPYKRYCADA